MGRDRGIFRVEIRTLERLSDLVKALSAPWKRLIDLERELIDLEKELFDLEKDLADLEKNQSSAH